MNFLLLYAITVRYFSHYYVLRFLFMDNRLILCETRLLGRQPHASVQRVLEQITKWWLKPVQLYSNCINSKKAFNDFESVLFCSIKSVNDMIMYVSVGISGHRITYTCKCGSRTNILVLNHDESF